MSPRKRRGFDVMGEKSLRSTAPKARVASARLMAVKGSGSAVRHQLNGPWNVF